MPHPPADSPDDIAAWDGAGPPRSRRHGDIYFSADDGLGEARSVFLVGCELPAAWAGRRQFTVGELGLGAGLNIAALLHLWSETRPAGAHLQIFSVENDLLGSSEVARALAPWPEIAGVTSLLTSRWPSRARGFHRVDLPQLSATLDVAVMDGREGLAAWPGQASTAFPPPWTPVSGMPNFLSFSPRGRRPARGPQPTPWRALSGGAWRRRGSKWSAAPAMAASANAWKPLCRALPRLKPRFRGWRSSARGSPAPPWPAPFAPWARIR